MPATAYSSRRSATRPTPRRPARTRSRPPSTRRAHDSTGWVTRGLLARHSHCGVVLGCFKAALRAPLLRSGAPRPDGRSAALTQPPRHASRRMPSRGGAGAERQGSMLRIYETMIGVMGRLKPVMIQIETHDRDLARQLRRASSSVALNLCEGSGSHGGTRRERYRNALGSARETGACIDVAVALGYVEGVDAGLLDALDKVRATLVRVLA